MKNKYTQPESAFIKKVTYTLLLLTFITVLICYFSSPASSQSMVVFKKMGNTPAVTMFTISDDCIKVGKEGHKVSNIIHGNIGGTKIYVTDFGEYTVNYLDGTIVGIIHKTREGKRVIYSAPL